MAFDPYKVRGQFPALRRDVGGLPATYLDGPGGTQVPQSVIDAMTGYLAAGGSNLGGDFATSRETDEVNNAARRAVADLFNAKPEEIAFGQNMTSITLAVSRALAATWDEGDEIVVTRLDHDANVWPWVMAARDRGVEVRWVDFDPDEGCTLDTASLRDALSPRTKLVAVTHASNAVGSIVDVRLVAKLAHEAGALVYVDAVHYTPHVVVDVVASDCDFLVASAYKFFGPHTGVLYGKHEHLAAFDFYKIRPAPSDPPGKWETGTQSFESLAGVTAAVDYLAGIGDDKGDDRRAALRSAMSIVREHEEELTRRFLAGLERIDGVTLFGIADDRPRTPTFAIDVEGVSPAEVGRKLGEKGIFVWDGHYYAVEVMERLGVLDAGGLVRIGFVHYNTSIEVDRVLEALELVSAGKDLGESTVFVSREDVSVEFQPYRAYELTDLPDPRTVSRSRLAEGIAEIVAVEGPVTTDRTYQVFVKSSGGKKVTKPVRDDLDWAVDLLTSEGKLELDRFEIANGESQTVLRRPGMPRVISREMGERDLYKVPLSEIAALVGSLASGGSETASDEELKRATLEAYGLKRLTPLASSYLDAAFRLAGVG